MNRNRSAESDKDCCEREADHLFKLWKTGYSIAYIAGSSGCTTSEIRRQLEELWQADTAKQPPRNVDSTTGSTPTTSKGTRLIHPTVSEGDGDQIGAAASDMQPVWFVLTIESLAEVEGQLVVGVCQCRKPKSLFSRFTKLDAWFARAGVHDG